MNRLFLLIKAVIIVCNKTKRGIFMKKSVWLSMVGISLLALGACGKEKEKETTTSKISESTIVSSEKTKETTESKEKKADVGNWQEINDQLKKTTEAKKLTVQHESKEAIVNEKDGVKVAINGYEYVEINDFSKDLRITFADQVEKGGVILVSTTLKNDSDKSVYTSAGYTISVTGFSSAISRNKSLLGTDVVDDLVKVKYEIKPKEEFTGYVALPVKPEAMEKIAENGEAMFELPGMYSKPESFKKEDAIIEPKESKISLSGEGAEKAEAQGAFYEDKATVENLGEKKMLIDQKDGKQAEFEGAKVTLDGYQITEFTPNEDEAPRYKNFDTGVIVLTAKVTIKNDGKETLNLGQTSATLTIGNKEKLMHENMLEINNDEELPTGKEGSKFIVFAMDKESYEKLYHDKEFKLDVSLYDQKFVRLTDNDDLAFTFTNK